MNVLEASYVTNRINERVLIQFIHTCSLPDYLDLEDVITFGENPMCHDGDTNWVIVTDYHTCLTITSHEWSG
jgi:hypothetical protein